MAAVLARSLPPDAAVSDVRIVYLRYSPGKRLIVRYRVTVGNDVHDATALAEPASDLPGWAENPDYRALARKVDGRAPARDPLSYERDVEALVQWLPLDVTMPTLAAEPAELRVLLRGAGVDLAESGPGPDLLAYKARRRAVLRLDDHVVKLYVGDDDFENAVVGLRASAEISELAVPAEEAVLPVPQLTCQQLLAGKPPQGHHAAARAAGSVLARLHATPSDGLRVLSPPRQLQAAASSARSAAAVSPPLRSRLEKLMSELELATPDISEPVAAHGDFHANQVLEQDHGLALIDFDEVCAAPAALDFSSYVAHLVNGVPGELEAAATALDDLIAGYGSRPAGLSWYVATSIVRRAPFPFRFMEDDWPVRIEQMVSAAEETLQA